MSNHASVTVIFDGSQKQLNKIYDMILVDGIEGKSVNFNYIEPFLPGLSDRQIYALFGADVDKDYSQEEIDIFHNKVNKLLSDNGWIGLRMITSIHHLTILLLSLKKIRLLFKLHFLPTHLLYFFTK